MSLDYNNVTISYGKYGMLFGRWRFVFFLVSIIPMFFVMLSVLVFSVNIPHWDDYVVFLKYVNSFVQTDSYIDRLFSLLRQHNEHRIVLSRVYALLCYDIFGRLNFRVLVLFGIIPWIALYFVFLNNISFQGCQLKNTLPLALLFFSFSQWENFLWSTTSIQHYNMAVFAALSFFYASSTSASLQIASLIISSFGVFISGNGFLVFPICWILYLLHCKLRLVIISVLCFFVCCLIYFYGFVSPVPIIWHNYFQLLVRWDYYCFAFTFLGSYTGESVSALILGILLVACIPLLFFQLHNHQSRFAFAVLLFCLCSGLLSAGTRLERYGLERALLPYHAIFSSLSLASVYLAFVTQSSIRWLRAAPLIFVLIFSPFYVMNLKSGFHSLLELSSSLTSGMRIYFESGDKNALSCYHVGIAEKALQEGLLLGTYRYQAP